MKVFLGGTCNGSKWREEIIPLLKIDYFNPVVENWTEECKREELLQREICDYLLYIITPLMTGVYSIAEAVDDSHRRNSITIFCFLYEENNLSFNQSQIDSLTMVGSLIQRNGGIWLPTLIEVAKFLNHKR